MRVDSEQHKQREEKFETFRENCRSHHKNIRLLPILKALHHRRENNEEGGLSPSSGRNTRVQHVTSAFLRGILHEVVCAAVMISFACDDSGRRGFPDGCGRQNDSLPGRESRKRCHVSRWRECRGVGGAGQFWQLLEQLTLAQDHLQTRAGYRRKLALWAALQLMHLERGRGEETASQSRTSWSPSRAVRTPRSAPAARTDVTKELAVETSPRGLDVVQDPMLREAKVQNLETRVCCGKCDHESRGCHGPALLGTREKAPCMDDTLVRQKPHESLISERRRNPFD